MLKSDTFEVKHMMGEMFLAQLRQETQMWTEMLRWMKEHPPIKSPLRMVCGTPWWIWYDELGDPIRFQWVEDRLNPNV